LAKYIIFMKKKFWSFLELFETVLIAVIAVVLIRTFIAQPFIVSGSSMEPSFQSGNYLLVDEFSYYFRAPERGEVLVFKNPSNESSYYIKRIIGLPGERVIIDGGKVFIYQDGKQVAIDENYIDNSSFDVKNYDTVLDSDEYFVMGDNRGFSFDSRNWGPLKENKIVGLVRLRLWPISKATAIEKPQYK